LPKVTVSFYPLYGGGKTADQILASGRRLDCNISVRVVILHLAVGLFGRFGISVLSIVDPQMGDGIGFIFKIFIGKVLVRVDDG